MTSGFSRTTRWWWEHEHGVKLTAYDILEPTCGERGCLNPDHRQHVRRSRQIYTEAQMLGGLQVLAMRLGHPPTTYDWARSGRKPTTNVYQTRFGTWEKALAAAGFTAYHSITRIVSRADCIRALQFVHRLTGKWPTREAFENHRDQLTAQGLPRSGTSITTHLGNGSWPAAISQAKNQTAERPL